MNKRFCALIILDGFGIAPESPGNAISVEGTPFIKSLIAKYSHTQIGASGLDVGLPDGQMGNSEVGHLNIGAGRIVYQELTRISKSISDGDFFENEEFLDAMASVKSKGRKLHLMGLLSDGGVHSHTEHLFALIKMAKMQGLDNVYVHCFLDGRDVSPTSGAGYIAELEKYMKEISFGKIATVSGRYYAMDRDNRWERVQKAYDAMTVSEGVMAEDAEKAVRDSYEQGVTDEFVLPVVITDGGKPVAAIEKDDSVIFFNFRPDRAREMTRALTAENFDGFTRKSGYLTPKYVCMTQYDATFDKVSVAFKNHRLENTLGEYFAKNGIKQLRIAETEKYAHVTFFFNGGVEQPNEGETRVLIPSPKVATYDLKPEMSAPEVTRKAVELIESGEFDAMILNYANCDMVGHTGVMEAAVKAVEAVDNCLKELLTAILGAGGMAIITADHGNADKMIDADGSVFTAHSTNPVPVIIADDVKSYGELREGGRLCDLAPTMLTMMGLAIPSEMTGKSLIKG